MTESLKRFTPEQYELVRREILEECTNAPLDSADAQTMLAILGPDRDQAAALGMLHLHRSGHGICCAGSFIGIFLAGFLHGWRSREMLQQCDELERTVGDTDEGAAGTR